MSDDHTSYDVLVAKCAAIVCLFGVTTIFGGIPFIFNHYFKWTDNNSNTRSAKVVTYLLHVGGGVLLATTFIHLLPEVQHVVKNLQERGEITEMKFALPESLMCAGFILMYLIEECIHSYLHTHKKSLLQRDDGIGAAFERGHSVRRSTLVMGSLKSQPQQDDEDRSNETEKDLKVDSNCTLTTSAGSNAHIYQHGHFASVKVGNNKSPLDLDIQICPHDKLPKCKIQEYPLQNSLEYSHGPLHGHTHNCSHEHAHHSGDGHSHLPLNAANDGDILTTSFRGLGIVLALSLHEVFEGLAIGLEKSTSSVWFLFGAVTAHKLVLAFCVSVELIVARTRPILSIVYSLTFAIITPIGIGIGIAVSHHSARADDGMASMVMQGIACGTLLYVVFFEILSKEHVGFGAFISMLIGFAVMFGLQNIGASHNHHAHDHYDGNEIIVNSTKISSAAFEILESARYP